VEDGEMSAGIDLGGAGSGDPAADVLPAWSVFSPEQRPTFREALGVDDGTWVRGRGWALSVALLIISFYEETNPAFTEMACCMVSDVLIDFERQA
jgi:aminoglycoside phosphotransferase (APT) family kinase protein